MSRLTLSQRLFLVACVAVVPSLLILGMTFWTLRNEADRRLRDEAASAAQFAKLELGGIIGGIESVLKAVASTPVVRSGQIEACNDLLGRVVTLTPELSDMMIADSSGQVICQSLASPTRVSVADRDYFRAAQTTPEIVTGSYVTARLSGRKTVPIALRLGEETAWPGAVIAGGLDLEWLQARLKARNLAAGSALTIADRNGVIIAREPQPERFVGTRIPDTYLPLVTASAPGTMQVVSQDGTRRMIGYVPSGVGFGGLYVSAGVGSDAIYAATNRLILQGGMVATAGIGLTLLLATFTSNYFIRAPFRRLIATAEAWQRDELQSRTGMGDDAGEFGRAGRALDSFMDQLTVARAARRAAESQRETLAQELDHRVKNIFATVQAIARQTFRGHGMDDTVRSFTQRLQAMSKAHQVLMQDGWQSAPIGDLATEAAAPFVAVHRSNFQTQGPDILLTSRAAMSLSMALHELCTNAAKYGALSSPFGTVHLSWRIGTGDEGPEFQMDWTETGGPPVEPPTRRGFGSRMIEEVLSRQLGGHVAVDYRAEGLSCRITAPAAAVLSDAAPADAAPREFSVGLRQQA